MVNTKPISSLKTKLKVADLEIQKHVLNLEKKVLKLEKQNLKLKKLNVTLKNRINVLEGNPKKWSHPKEEKGGDISLNIVSHKKSP